MDKDIPEPVNQSNVESEPSSEALTTSVEGTPFLKTSPLIEGFPRTFCTIDRITIVGNLNKPLSYLNRWQAQTDVNEMRLCKFPYRHQWTSTSNYVVQQRDRDASIPELRIEFNPNTLVASQSFFQIISNLIDQRVTRLDYAVDYPYDISKYLFNTVMAKKSVHYRGRSNELETQYIGKRNSGNMYRIYNKALESKLEGVLWRIEHELHFDRDADWRSVVPFEDLNIITGEFISPLLKDRAMLYYLADHPYEWKGMNDRTRAKYKKMLHSSEHTIPFDAHPWKIYSLVKPKLQALVTAFLSPAPIPF